MTVIPLLPFPIVHAGSRLATAAKKRNPAKRGGRFRRRQREQAEKTYHFQESRFIFLKLATEFADSLKWPRKIMR
jgi:hypothetical protein